VCNECNIYMYPYHMSCVLLQQDQWTPLHFAAHNNNVEVVKSLIKLGADVNSVTKVSYCIQ